MSSLLVVLVHRLDSFTFDGHVLMNSYYVKALISFHLRTTRYTINRQFFHAAEYRRLSGKNLPAESSATVKVGPVAFGSNL